ncbi:MAG: DegT/DnrJ/EryC1/StrS family aminotransferase [Lautropia sp.]
MRFDPTADDPARAPLPFVDLKTPYRQRKTEIDGRIQTVLDHGQFIMGPEVAELESVLAAFCRVPHAVGVADGTTALMIAMMALDVGPGDEIITTPFTFIATGEMISILGATPVFVDIDPRTFNLDPALIEAAITPRTRAILPVSLYGQCADLDAINTIAARHGLAVIEDAAQSFGAENRGRRSGSLTTIACTSFFPSKPLGCYGDGGACFTADAALAERMRRIRVHGQAERYRHVAIGLNGRLDTIQAAVLLAKLPVFPDEVRARREAAARYTSLLSDAGLAGTDPDAGAVVAPFIGADDLSVYAQYTIRVAHRDAVAAHMKACGIPTAVHYPIPLHRQPVYEPAFGALRLPVAERAAAEVLSLPMHPYLTAQDQQRVVDALAAAVRRR